MSTELETLLNAEAATRQLLDEAARLKAELAKYGQAGKSLAQTRDELSRLVAATQVLTERALDAVTATKEIGTPALLAAQKEVAQSVERLTTEVKAVSERELKSVGAEVAGMAEKVDATAQQMASTVSAKNSGMLAGYSTRLAEIASAMDMSLRTHSEASKSGAVELRHAVSKDLELGLEQINIVAGSIAESFRTETEARQRTAAELRGSVSKDLQHGLGDIKAAVLQTLTATTGAQKDSILKLETELAGLRRETARRQQTIMGLFILTALLVLLVGALAFPAVRAACGLSP